MRFEKLKLCGFKSFVDPAELRIDPGLTGVVGPNGCGKSNLLEAIRWVMGESSPKSLRGGGMEDVIFAGTAARPARDFAEVVLFARGSLASNDDADGEIEVSRRIERGAGSAYRINGREARARDVALVFADAATGAHSPALVSQGRIAAVIAAKPAERRMMLEEAAGIAGLHVRRRDAEARLRATEANLARLDELLAGLAAQIAALRRQARSAERYRALSEQIRLAEARQLFASWRAAAATAEAAGAEVAAAEAAVAAAQDGTLHARLADNAATAALAASREALTGQREETAAHRHRQATLAGKLEAAGQRLADLHRQLTRLAADGSDAEQVIAAASAARARLDHDLAGSAAELQDTAARAPALAAALEQAEGTARAAERALAHIQAEQAGAEAEQRIAQAAVASAEAALSRHAGERTRRGEQATMLVDQAEPIEAAASAAVAAVAEASTALAAALTGRDTLQASRAGLSAERDSAGDALASARAELAAAEREGETLRREQAAGRSDDAGATALARIRARPGYERALGAVLGRDAGAVIGAAPSGAPGRYWTGAPPPPPLADSLAAHVGEAPPELAARLALVRFADDDEGASVALAPGQWLVTRDGRLRRWDGLVAYGEGAREAAALEAANRLVAVERTLATLRQRHDAAAAHAQATASRLADVQAALGGAEQAVVASAAAERRALRALDQAETARERQAARQAEIEAALGELAKQGARLSDELAAATARRNTLPDPALGRERLGRARNEDGAARTALQSAAAVAAGNQSAAATAGARQAMLTAEIRNWQARAGDAEQRLAALAGRRDEIAGEQAVEAARRDALHRELGYAEASAAALAEAAAAAESSLAQAEHDASAAARRLSDLAEALATARETRAGAAARADSAEARRDEAARTAGERFASPPPRLPGLFAFAAAEVADPAIEAATLERLRGERERLGAVNLVAADELAAAEVRHAESAGEQAELAEAVNRLRGSIGNLNRQGRERLRSAFAAVDGHFRRLFARLFDGGAAHLAMIDSDDPLEAGLEIFAHPPGKRLQSLTLLSGGEQALTAIALIFALFLTKPSPICVLDEVDAPLDDANVERFCDLLDAMAGETDTRYLIVTHNAVTMSRLHRLFGVTMVEQGVSRLVSVDLGEAEELLAAE